MRSRKPHRRTLRRTKRAKIQKNKKRFNKLIGGDPYGVYSSGNSSQQTFDIFMEKIKSAKILSRGIGGITLVVESEYSPHKLLFKLSPLNDKYTYYIVNGAVAYTKEKYHEHRDVIITFAKEKFKKKKFTQDEAYKFIEDNTKISETVGFVMVSDELFPREFELQKVFYQSSMLTESGSNENYSLCPKPYYCGHLTTTNINQLIDLLYLTESTKSIEYMILEIWKDTGTKVGVITMEYLESYQPLDDFLKNSNDYCLYTAMAIYASIRLAITCGLVHNDLHTNNIMVDQTQKYFEDIGEREIRGRVMLIDFGLTDLIDDETIKKILENYHKGNLVECFKIISDINRDKKFEKSGQHYKNGVLQEIINTCYKNSIYMLNNLKEFKDKNTVGDRKVIEDERYDSDENCKRLGYRCNSLFSLNKTRCKEKCRNHQITQANNETCKQAGFDCFSRFKWNAEGCKKSCATYIGTKNDNDNFTRFKKSSAIYIGTINGDNDNDNFTRFKQFLYFMKDKDKRIHKLLCNKLFVQYLMGASNLDELKILCANEDGAFLLDNFNYVDKKFSDFKKDGTKFVELDDVNIEDIQKDMNCHKFLYDQGYTVTL